MRTSTQIEGYNESGWGLRGKQITTMNPETESEYFSMDAVIRTSDPQHYFSKSQVLDAVGQWKSYRFSRTSTACEVRNIDLSPKEMKPLGERLRA